MRILRLVSVACAAAVVVFVGLSVLAPQEFGPFYLTGASVALGAFVLVMGSTVAAYSARNLFGQRRQARFGALLALCVVALWLLVVADPIWLTALAWSVSGVTVAGLIAHADTVRARSAARRVALRLAVGDVALWAAVLLMMSEGVTRRSDLTEIGWAVPAMLAAAGVVRSALVPAWRWLPLTAEAPSPVSALLHAGVVNGLGVLAVLWWPLFAGAPGVLVALALIGVVTVVLGSAAVKVRPDVKGKLASSTSAQMGYMTIQVGLGLPAFALLHLIGHGFYKSWLFLRAGGAPRRALPAPLTGARSAVVAALAVPVMVAVALGTLTWSSRPVVDLVPLAFVGATALAALIALSFPDQALRAHTSPASRLAAMVTVLVGLAGYVVLLGAWSNVFGQAMVFTGQAAVVLTSVVLITAALGLYAVGRGWLTPAVQTVVVDTADRIRGRVAHHTSAPQTDTQMAVEAAARLVGPMWPIKSAVAVNPLRGLQDLKFADAAQLAQRTWQAGTYLSEADYAAAMRAGRFTREDLIAAARGLPLPAEQVADYMQLLAEWQSSAQSRYEAHAVLSEVADRDLELAYRADGRVRTLGEQAGIAEEVSGLANSWTGLLMERGDLWPAFQERIRDFGLRGLRAFVQSLPADPQRAVGSVLDGMVPAEAQVGYLSRLLTRDPGWAAHLQQRDPRLVTDLLAIRAVFDVVAARVRGVQEWSAADDTGARERAAAAIEPVVELLGVQDAQTAMQIADLLGTQQRCELWQRAWERRYGNRLVDRVCTRAALGEVVEPVLAHIVMCIDVRSERMRRHIEAAGAVATYGYAGFFGLPIQVEKASGPVTDQCPVLLSPSHRVFEDDRQSRGGYFRSVRGGLVAAGQRPGAPFALAEGLGVLAGFDAVLQTAAPGIWGRWRGRLFGSVRGPVAHASIGGIDLQQRVTSAAVMLRSMGLVRDFGPVILVTGHAATVENNAFAAAYDCGACGGHGGFVNARVMAEILNDPTVRATLRDEHGITVPAGTVAIPAWHNTTTDEVMIDDQDVPAQVAEEVQVLRRILDVAGAGAVAERLQELPRAGVRTQSAAFRRASDWAQPQPEWGLAGNAAFVIGPRRMTKGLNLRGRVFLHSYDPGLDVDGAILETLLTAPMVVTQWINNQYYFATVDPQRFGAGDKTTHNVVSDIGVVTGAGGDLRVGLPWQSVYRHQPGSQHDLQHEPLRLRVVVYASPQDIDRVLHGHPQVAALIANEWIHLAAIDPRDATARSLGSDLRWTDWLDDDRSPVMDRQG